VRQLLYGAAVSPLALPCFYAPDGVVSHARKPFEVA
jgi:hypothetical protein